MKLAIDVMGFENNIGEAIKSCRKFSKTHKGVQLILVGAQTLIAPFLKSSDRLIIHDATQTVLMDDQPLVAIRKTNSSMYQAIKLVADDQAQGVLSAGSTSCYILMVYTLLKLIPKISKPGFMPYLPTLSKTGLMLIDVGASKTCTGKDLYYFAIMADIYLREVKKIPNPRINVINIGTEENKGFEFHQQADTLLKADSQLNYQGFIEPKFLLNGKTDLAVCDGYTGNIVLKTLEGSMQTFGKILKQSYLKPWAILGALLSVSVIYKIMRTFNYKTNAGALVLGVNKVAVKTHGSADKKEFYSAIRILYDSVDKNVVEHIKKSLAER